MPVCGQVSEIPEQLFSVIRANGFWMELDTPLGQCSVADSHDGPVFGSGRHNQRFRQIVYGQGVVADNGKGGRNVFEKTCSVM